MFLVSEYYHMRFTILFMYSPNLFLLTNGVNLTLFVFVIIKYV